LIALAEPYAIPIGLAIALAEIAIGLGALTGLAFRVAAIGGATLSILFWLTVSWTTHPYYYGPDLPYAVGWITLALAGTGGLEIVRPRMTPDAPVSPGRRALLQTATLAGLALVVGSLAVPLRMFGSSRPTPEPTPEPTPAPTPEPTTSVPDGSIPIATTADVGADGSLAFTVPFRAPAPLPAGDPGIIVRLPDGRFVAFDAVCTHAACTVGWDAETGLLACPCHGATFDPARDAAVVSGPAELPLMGLPLVIDPGSGAIYLAVDSGAVRSSMG
jgi:thiosulfate dehydrogenase (quinone) large subunit